MINLKHRFFIFYFCPHSLTIYTTPEIPKNEKTKFIERFSNFTNLLISPCDNELSNANYLFNFTNMRHAVVANFLHDHMVDKDTIYEHNM